MIYTSLTQSKDTISCIVASLVHKSYWKRPYRVLAARTTFLEDADTFEMPLLARKHYGRISIPRIKRVHRAAVMKHTFEHARLAMIGSGVGRRAIVAVRPLVKGCVRALSSVDDLRTVVIALNVVLEEGVWIDIFVSLDDAAGATHTGVLWVVRVGLVSTLVFALLAVWRRVGSVRVGSVSQ